VELIGQKEFLQKAAGRLEPLPFCFQKGHLKINKNICFFSDKKFFAPVEIKNNKSFKTIQFQFPPVALSGNRMTSLEEKVFCKKAVEYIRLNKIAHRIQQPQNYCLFSATPDGSTTANFGTYRIPLYDLTEAEILKNMQARYRTAINQVEKLNVSIKSGPSELKAFHQLHEETMGRTDAYFESFFSLKKEFESMPDNTLLSTVYIGDVLQGGLYMKYSSYSAFYLHGASSNTTQASGAIKYLHYKMMCLMKQKGVRYYDFVGARMTDVSGTKLEGIQNFKKRFGSELMKGYLWKMDIDKTVCRSFDLLLKVKCKLKGTTFPKDIIDQEKNKSLVHL
jgi:hypothetical protein